MELGSPSTPRWVQRFANFDRAMMRLREAMTAIAAPDATMLMKEGAIQRFEYTFELGWKTLMDFLDFNKVTLERRGPADVIRKAFAAGYIDNGQDWMDALDARNQMSHVYEQGSFERVLVDIKSRYAVRLDQLNQMLTRERDAMP